MLTTNTPLATAPAPVNPRAGSGVGGWRAATRGRSAPRRLGRLVFWLLIVLFIIAPSACFLAYTASSPPTNSRVLVGVVSQLQPSLKDAARTHGAGEVVAWPAGSCRWYPGRSSWRSR